MPGDVWVFTLTLFGQICPLSHEKAEEVRVSVKDGMIQGRPRKAFLRKSESAWWTYWRAGPGPLPLPALQRGFAAEQKGIQWTPHAQARCNAHPANTRASLGLTLQGQPHWQPGKAHSDPNFHNDN